MKWHKLEDISRVVKVNYQKGFFNNMICLITGGIGISRVYQYGIKLINEDGETKEVWER